MRNWSGLKYIMTLLKDKITLNASPACRLGATLQCFGKIDLEPELQVRLPHILHSIPITFLSSTQNWDSLGQIKPADRTEFPAVF